MKPVEVHAAVQALLMEHGRYDALELLLRAGFLDYQAYRAWRRGDVRTLDGALGNGSGRAEEALRAAAAWADRLGLESNVVELCGWEENAGAVLAASSNPHLDRLISTAYRPPETDDQLDLFSHGAETVARIELLNALVTRDRPRALQGLERLAARAPGHRDLANARSLVDALGLPPPVGAAEAVIMLQRVEQDWLPAANALLEARSRDFLAPIWQTIAMAMEGMAFDPERPRFHASWLFAQCLDWRGVRRSVQAVADFRRHAVLVARLADAERRLGARAAAIELWSELCWTNPEVFGQRIDAAEFPDWGVKQAWLRAKAEDLEPELTAEWFPAWLLLQEPGLARALPAAGRTGAAAQAYDIVRQLLMDQERDMNGQIGLRRHLQRIHPGLLARYLAGLTDR